MSERILIVDDEVKILQGFSRMLYRKFSMDTASSGKEALEMIVSSGPYAVIVSDMHMPGMSGEELLNEVRERSPNTVRI